MPNWCMNTMTVSCGKEHKKELQAFKAKGSCKEIVKKASLKGLRDEWIKKNESNFVKEGKLSQWVKVSNLSLNNFCIDVLGFSERNGEMYKGDSDLSMNKLLPCPEELRGESSPLPKKEGETDIQFVARMQSNIDKHGVKDWYDWQCEAWGTKWDIDAQLNNESDTELIYTFDSAWAPPSNFVHKVSFAFPNLKISLEYEEPGMCFRGTFVCQNGKELAESVHEDGYTPTCHECEEEYDNEGECSCTRETVEEEHPVNQLLRDVVAKTDKTKKKK